MFTGIIESLGRVQRIEQEGSNYHFTINSELASELQVDQSLAHNGVLFLDELPEFKRTVLEVLRQPMEERKVTISRARISVDYPSAFVLIASMNP